MKKIVLIAIVLLISSKSNAFEDLTSVSRMPTLENHTTFLDSDSLEDDLRNHHSDYATSRNMLEDIEEYDKNVSDNVTPPKIGKAEALFKEMLGVLLIRYISLRENMQTYFRNAKAVLAQWYHRII